MLEERLYSVHSPVWIRRKSCATKVRSFAATTSSIAGHRGLKSAVSAFVVCEPGTRR